MPDDDELKANLKKFKKKPKLTVPADFLDNAKSYDDKLLLVQHLTDKEKGRVLLIIKSMLKDAVANKGKKWED